MYLSKPFFFNKKTRRKEMKKTVKKTIGYRKNCKATGTGLSHYILIKQK